MMIPLIDVILIIIIAGFVFYGFFFGLIRMVGVFFGIVIGGILASRFYLTFYDWIDVSFFGYDNLGRISAFFILFSILSKLISFGFYILDRTFKIVSIIPFLGTFNKVGGVVFGLVSGSLFTGLILFVASRYSLLESIFGQLLIDSKVAPVLLSFTKIIIPLLPGFLKSLNSLI